MTTPLEQRHNLTPFEWWMVNSNLKYVKTEGVDSVVLRLTANGYPRIASAVQDAAFLREQLALAETQGTDAVVNRLKANGQTDEARTVREFYERKKTNET